jgi:C4-dicarboxylate-specific signal transduction histidine kinase
MRVATVGGLSGGIAHELGQPLASILANAQAAETMLAKNNPDLEEVSEALTEIIQQDIRAGELIRRLRQLLQKQEHRNAPVGLNDLIGSTVQLLHFELENRSIKVDMDLKSALPTVSGDTVELQQVLINLIMNAIEAMTSTDPSQRRPSALLLSENRVLM